MKAFKYMISMCLIFASMLTIGCGDTTGPGDGDDDDDDKKKANPTCNGIDDNIIGMWLYTGAQVNGKATDLGTAMDWAPGAVAAGVEIRSDGLFEYLEVSADGAETGYVLGEVCTGDPDYIKFYRTDVEGEVVEYDGTWKRSGQTLTFTLDGDGNVTRLTARWIEPNRSLVTR